MERNQLLQLLENDTQMRRPVLVIIGGYLTAPTDFAALAAALEAPPYNYRVFITPISRARWALTRDWDFRIPVARLQATVQQARALTGVDRVTILAHSVGGTTARIYLGDQPYRGQVYGGHRYVERLITLGTPHQSREHWTRRVVGFTNGTYPGAFYQHVHYVALVGRALQGHSAGTLRERMASRSYTLVSGAEHAHDWGDGITTLLCAALRGAEYLVVPGLYHTRLHGRPWYGDPAALPWWDYALGLGGIRDQGIRRSYALAES